MMPSTKLITGTWAKSRSQALLEALQRSIVTGLEVPEDDRDIIAEFIESENRIVPSGHDREKYTRIEILLYSGRELATKRRLYTEVINELTAFGLPKEEIKVILVEMPCDNWGIRGGIPGSEVDSAA
ncbi:tautomerase family protein [Phyllobacterium endophyticum]|uniref:4-oxalocrotonate tautomerase n=1 Tax=Phyllobacterium endophyticum TaxID=1149773 RepID=A0A2P7AKC8_9HYPH|nr:tautomerase family protein [Phyllobacterium endophyticum]MBB3237093.1 phenylpyruvate tautomerase PptA (4-oxalocrotonate tautomerase family) [Phyllobacterium endophyticum]PSH54671.1 4-oxalocrotonate tautomerase [Phyllobacterium endophyticum]TYR40562.1 tautomerase family protein [Phyllobacterium endophyticum]